MFHATSSKAFVYLDPADMARMRNVESEIRDQAVGALHKELASLNKPGPNCSASARLTASCQE